MILGRNQAVKLMLAREAVNQPITRRQWLVIHTLALAALAVLAVVVRYAAQIDAFKF